MIVGVVKDDLSIHKRDMMQLVVLSVACLVTFIGRVSFTVLRLIEKIYFVDSKLDKFFKRSISFSVNKSFAFSASQS